MSNNKAKTKGKDIIKLEGNLTVYEVGALKENLLSALKDVDLLEIDMADVRECDTSGLQILCSAKKTADQRSKRIVFPVIPKAIEDAMIKTGITHEMIAHDGGAGCQR